MTKQPTNPRPLFLNPEEAGRISGLGVNQIRRLMEEGKLEFLKNGNRKLTTIRALLDYYEREKTPAQ